MRKDMLLIAAARKKCIAEKSKIILTCFCCQVTKATKVNYTFISTKSDFFFLKNLHKLMSTSRDKLKARGSDLARACKGEILMRLPF